MNSVNRPRRDHEGARCYLTQAESRHCPLSGPRRLRLRHGALVSKQSSSVDTAEHARKTRNLREAMQNRILEE